MRRLRWCGDERADPSHGQDVSRWERIRYVAAGSWPDVWLPSLEDLRSGLQDVLAFHFDRPGPFDVIEHLEREYEIAGHELVTRIAQDEHRDQRDAVFERIGRALAVSGQAEALVSTVTNTVGEAVYVCAVPSDTLGWLTAQLHGAGDAVV